jgi:hypothetical protein
MCTRAPDIVTYINHNLQTNSTLHKKNFIIYMQIK